MPSLALFQPDIPQNTGTLIRLTACLGVDIHIILPAGFLLTDRNLKKAGMDYLDLARVRKHTSWEAFEAWRSEEGCRLIALTTKAPQPYLSFSFEPTDILLAGRESAGLPDDVHAVCDARLIIPMVQGRSLNVAVASSMVLGEALRQTGGFAIEA